MSIKRISATFLVAISVLSAPFIASASDVETYAGNGSWDYLGSQTFAVQSKEVKSNGGDFKFCVNRAGTYRFYDSANNKPKTLIGSKKLKKNGCATFRNLDRKSIRLNSSHVSI